jgi:hypothetical protein
MFTWICPQCGREVPPSYTECPDCAARTGAQTAVQETAPPPEAPAPAPAGTTAPQPVAVPPPRGAVIPVWVLSIILILAFLGLGASIYWGMQYFRGRSEAGSGPPLAMENPVKGAKTNPIQRYIEVTGIRLVQNAKKKTEARFLLVNHSNAEITGLEGTVTIWGRTRKSDEEAEGTFRFKAPSLGPYEAKEAVAPIDTRLKIYELPDWQNITAEVQITAPAP